MSKSGKIKLKGRELATRLTGILTPTGGISWKPPVDEWGKAYPQANLVALPSVKIFNIQLGDFGEY